MYLFLTLATFKAPLFPAVTYHYTQRSPSVSFHRYHSPPSALLISSAVLTGTQISSPAHRSILSIDNNKGEKNVHITTRLKHPTHLFT